MSQQYIQHSPNFVTTDSMTTFSFYVNLSLSVLPILLHFQQLFSGSLLLSRYSPSRHLSHVKYLFFHTHTAVMQPFLHVIYYVPHATTYYTCSMHKKISPEMVHFTPTPPPETNPIILPSKTYALIHNHLRQHGFEVCIPSLHLLHSSHFQHSGLHHRARFGLYTISPFLYRDATRSVR